MNAGAADAYSHPVIAQVLAKGFPSVLSSLSDKHKAQRSRSLHRSHID